MGASTSKEMDNEKELKAKLPEMLSDLSEIEKRIKHLHESNKTDENVIHISESLLMLKEKVDHLQLECKNVSSASTISKQKRSDLNGMINFFFKTDVLVEFLRSFFNILLTFQLTMLKLF